MSSSELNVRPLRVLLIEDNLEDAFLIERHLRRNGFEPSMYRVETDAEMRVSLEGESLPDVILADYNLPYFSGPAALALLKGLRLDIPFIMLSGAVSEETAVSSLRAGAQDYIAKQNLARLVPAIERELTEVANRRREQATQRALLASESRFDRLVAAMPLGLLIADADQRVVYANGALDSMLQHQPGHLRGAQCSLDDIFTEPTAIASALRNDFSGHNEPLFESTCRLSDGNPIQVLISVMVLNPDNSLDERRLAIFVADITLRKKSEEMLRRTEKLAVAGRLAAVIAHEINNPLTSITNCLYLIEQCELSVKVRGLLDLAQSELNRISQITVQTLRFHRSSTHARSTNLQDLVETVLAMLSSRIAAQDIAVARHFSQVPSLIVHDGEIRQLATNLVVNAIDALPRGGRLALRIRSSTHPESRRAGVTLTVADNGVGMDKTTKSRLFEPFFSTKDMTGTGLGLWVGRGIVEKHGGEIQFRSRQARPGQSGRTICTVFLPFENGTDATAEPEQSREAS
jgi:signal transduction histidine kinase